MNRLPAHSDLHVEAGIRQAWDDAQEGTFSPLGLDAFIAREQEAKEGRPVTGLDNVLAAQFLLTATLYTLEQPQLKAGLPLEIVDRATVARSCAESVVRRCVDSDRLRRLYTDHDLLGIIAAKKPVGYFANKDYFEALTGSVFDEAAFCAGGALRVLQKAQVPNPSQAVLNSDNLAKAVARIRATPTNLRTMYSRLGFPYVRNRFLRVVNADKAVFTDEAYDILARLQKEDSGCPALRLKSDELSYLIAEDYPDFRGQLPKSNVVAQSWQDITAYLVPEGATARTPNTRPQTIKQPPPSGGHYRPFRDR